MRKGSVSIGANLGRLTVIDKIDGAAGKHQRLICQCSCGSIRDVASHSFKAGKHCSCLVAEKTLVGRTCGKVEVIELLAKNSEIKGKRGHLYKCKCTQCTTYYNYPTNAILRIGFTGCRCVSDKAESSKKSNRHYQLIVGFIAIGFKKNEFTIFRLFQRKLRTTNNE